MQAEGKARQLREVAGSPRDFRTFYEDEHRRLFQTLYFVTGNRHDAADLMHEAFLKMWERWDAIDEIQDVHAYLFKVALNANRTRARTARRAARRRIPLGVVHDPFDEIELREDVRQMLQGLTPRQRAALLLLDLYDYDSGEAARIMGVRPSTVRALATQGRAALRASGGSHA
ncbi:MAG TPA: sigma-70 family RNA polymerase sigma factor [Actinomycetota bacterium]|jgi:RNA polymerase sigma factor (sigma-70 family)|nr:sigma-70 family RNA polymerase sigma factor [Actinomycetota bacterium]